MSPDSIVPTSTQGTQAWDRYAFVNNNPVRYTDPTGHNVISFSDLSQIQSGLDVYLHSDEVADYSENVEFWTNVVGITGGIIIGSVGGLGGQIAGGIVGWKLGDAAADKMTEHLDQLDQARSILGDAVTHAGETNSGIDCHLEVHKTCDVWGNCYVESAFLLVVGYGPVEFDSKAYEVFIATLSDEGVEMDETETYWDGSGHEASPNENTSSQQTGGNWQ